MSLVKLTALQLAEKIKRKEVTVSRALDALYEAAEAGADDHKSFISLCKEEAYQRAVEVQGLIDKGQPISPLAGVPLLVKDNICTKGVRTTAGSKMLENFKPPYDAFVIEKAQAAGMIVAGKTNMDEFAIGSGTQSSYFGPTFNPWDKSKVPGGSSGGNAAALAGDEGFIALGSDTGGSIRQPSAFCSVSGLRPTYGAVSRRGLIALAASMDTIGPMGKDLADCAALFEIIAGKDSGDATCHDYTFDYRAAFGQDIKGKKIGLPTEFFTDELDEDIKNALLDAVKTFEGLGAEIKETTIKENEWAATLYSVIASAEAASSLARYDGIRYGHSSQEAEDLLDLYVKSRSQGFGKAAKLRMMFGNFVLGSENYDRYCLKAQEARTLLALAYDKVFEDFDFLLGPVSSSSAYSADADFAQQFNCDSSRAYTAPAALLGLPALSVPCGFDKSGLPIGMQLMGKHFDEVNLLGLGLTFQEATDFHLQKPMKDQGGRA
ncbi:MAG: Asp-tRNA(Asn)/Glu-tRNA(Gln) amidotransferase subunit GatA [Clostridiales bacterium]|nr:Asp-tRNA(Asn)/Glu-tRNA(Gln) amidotransferase subunit GatA [Clostridiales bacterium]